MGSNKSRRRQKTKPTSNVMVWDDKSRLELLAYLNWSIQAGINFKATAERHLYDVTSKAVSFKQINRKLRREWQKCGKSDKFEDVYTQGTAALLDGEEDDQRIGAIVERLGPPSVPRYRLRKSSIEINSRSPTLSSVARSTSASSLQTTTCSPQPSRSKSRRLPPQERSMPPSPLASKTGETSRSRRSQQSYHAPVKGEASENSPFYMVAQSNSPEATIQPTARSNNHQDNPSVGTSSQISELTEQLERSHLTVLKQEASIFHLNELLSEARDEIERLHKYSKTISGDEEKLRDEFIYLRGKLTQQNSLLQSQKDYETRIRGFPSRDVIKQYETLFENVSESCLDLKSVAVDEVSPSQLNPSYKSIQTWSKKVTNLSVEHLVSYTKAEKIPLEKIVASLVGAAIFELIFERVFPESLTLESPLLFQYRSHILTRDGHQPLKRLDHLALESFTLRKYFTAQFIPEKAKSLSERIICNLQCFLPLGNEESNNFTPDRLRNFSVKLARRLKEALDLKIKFELSEAQFRFVYVKPNDTFCADIMEQDPPEQQHSDSSTEAVKMCLRPALYALSPQHREQDEEKDLKQFSANCNHNFTEASMDDLESFILLSKAVVLL